MKIGISIISHGNNAEVNSLLEQFYCYEESKEKFKIIVTCNIVDNTPIKQCDDFEIIINQNKSARGFSENHNLAFSRDVLGKCDYFLIVNPDVRLVDFDFESIFKFADKRAERSICFARNLSYAEPGEEKKVVLPGPKFISSIASNFIEAPTWVSGEFMFFH